EPAHHRLVQHAHVFLLHDAAVDELTRLVLVHVRPLRERHLAAGRPLNRKVRHEDILAGARLGARATTPMGAASTQAGRRARGLSSWTIPDRPAGRCRGPLDDFRRRRAPGTAPEGPHEGLDRVLLLLETSARR